ncbi:MAG: VWA domain-containing protein [Candidatus Aminicenantes bacterium]|nr:VWA domain-containing protein [Candidatus Aminicenantes bacterium]MDH5467839.1 VWA domain-containing protein [Candidatus Aminicenantes bacterium]MDH5704942.1 VWA domain-containing protein [Candidatus Aminicenantes bacterium]
MKRSIILIVFLFLTLKLPAQVEQHEVTVRNVVVPVRVLDGNLFVDNLTIEDFELFEDGKLQKIEALYLVQNSNIKRKEAGEDYQPQLSRHLYLLFQTADYNPRLAEAISHLFNNVIQPGDSLTVMTPMDTYTLSRRALNTKPKEVISRELQSIVRKDTQMGGANYRSLMTDLKRLVTSISASGGETKVLSGLESDSSTSMFSLENLLVRYQETMEKMENLRVVDEERFLQFAQQLKKYERQKSVFFFYQREFRPEISQSILNRLMSSHQDEPEILAQVQNLFQLYQRQPTFNTQRIIAAFADASISFNFIFMHKDPEFVSGVTMREQSEDMFNFFSQVAQATGGIIDSSQNPAYAFKHAADIAESYYLLYYSPIDYKKDGQFKSINIRLRDKNYKLTYRLGYIAN